MNAEARHLMRSGHAFQIFVPADSQQDPDRLVEVPDPAAVDGEHAEFGSDVTMQENDAETPPVNSLLRMMVQKITTLGLLIPVLQNCLVIF